MLRLNDFHEIRQSGLPFISALIDGLSYETSNHKQIESDHDDCEHHPLSYLCTFHVADAFTHNLASVVTYKIRAPYKSHKRVSDGPSLPRSFPKVYKDPHWPETVGREYKTLLKQETLDLCFCFSVPEFCTM